MILIQKTRANYLKIWSIAIGANSLTRLYPVLVPVQLQEKKSWMHLTIPCKYPYHLASTDPLILRMTYGKLYQQMTKRKQRVLHGCSSCCRYRGSYMSAHVLLILLNELGKPTKRSLQSILFLFCNEFNKFNNTRAGMLDYIYHWNLISCVQRDYFAIMLATLLWTSYRLDKLILMHNVISPKAPRDKVCLTTYQKDATLTLALLIPIYLKLTTKN